MILHVVFFKEYVWLLIWVWNSHRIPIMPNWMVSLISYYMQIHFDTVHWWANKHDALRSERACKHWRFKSQYLFPWTLPLSGEFEFITQRVYIQSSNWFLCICAEASLRALWKAINSALLESQARLLNSFLYRCRCDQDHHFGGDNYSKLSKCALLDT